MKLSLKITLFLCATALTGFGQGSLFPSGGPAPIMKSLEEVYDGMLSASNAAANAETAATSAETAAENAEAAATAAEPRTPLSDANTPGNSSWRYIIDTSGSYILTENVSAISQGGIQITADNVTLDMNGFTLQGDGSGSYDGINLTGVMNCSILNGSIYFFGGTGVLDNEYSLSGGFSASHLKVYENGDDGIDINSSGAHIDNCIAVTNGSSGIGLRDSAVVKDCVVERNSGVGISVRNSSVVMGCTSSLNGGSGISAYDGCTIMNNACSQNGYHGIGAHYHALIKNNTCSWNDVAGIDANHHCNILDNTINYNNQDEYLTSGGIRIPLDCTVKNNHIHENRLHGIYAYNTGNVIEENRISDSEYGIYFNNSDSFYDRNRFTNNGTDVYNSASQTDGGNNVSF